MFLLKVNMGFLKIPGENLKMFVVWFFTQIGMVCQTIPKLIKVLFERIVLFEAQHFECQIHDTHRLWRFGLFGPF